MAVKWRSGTRPPNRVYTTVNYSVKESDSVIGVDTTIGPVTITLLSPPSPNIARVCLVKDEGGNAAVNNITVDTVGSALIEGSATEVIDTAYGQKGFYSDGVDYYKI